jgi:PKD repeat protein
MRIGLNLLVITIFHFFGLSQNPQNLNISSSSSPNASVNQLLSLPQIKLWLRADTLISLNTDSTVNTWNDIVSNVTFSANTSATQQPTLTISPLLPGHPSVRFDGVNDGLIAASSVSLRNQKLTLIMVGKIISPTPIGHLVCSGTSAYGDWNFREAGTGQISFIHGNSNVGAGVTATTTTTQTYLVPQFFMFMATVNPGNPARWEIYENFSLKDVDNSASYGVGANNITLGYRSDVTNVFNANFDMAEFIIFDSIIPASQFDLINSYLVNRYSTKVDLGPDINETYSFCPKVLSTNIPYQEYLWSNGLTTPTISINQSGTYFVQTKDKYGLYSRDTIVVNFPNTNNPGDSIICPGNIFVWNTQLNNTGYTFVWQDSSNDSLFVINSAGIYSVTIADSFSCAITQSLSVSVDVFASGISLGPDTSLCAGNAITLASGAYSSHSYLWSTGSTNDSLLINTGGQYSVIVTNTNNCVAKDTINVNVVGFAPIANFTTSVGCINSIVNFTDLSVPPLGNTLTAYEWNFGDLGSATNTSTLSNPSHTYTNTGTYTVSLKVISNAGCEQTIRKTIQVFPKPTVNFISGISCQNDSTTFSSLTTSASGYSITSLNWNFGDPTSGTANTSSLISPKHLFSNQANYTIKLVATNNAGCKDSLINIIAVRAQVKADFTVSSPCANTATFFQDNSIVPPSPNTNIRTWNLGSGPVNGLTVSKTYTSPGVYYVTLTVNSSNQCSSSITKLISIFAAPTASFAIPAFCSKDTITATNLSVAQSGIITSTNWKLNSLNFSSIQNPTLSISNAGSYNVRLTVTNSFGCKDSITKAILVNPLPNADFTTNPTTYYYINSPVNFIPSITNASSYFWSISSIGTSTAQSPSATYNTEGTYTVSLNLQDMQGCKNSVTKTLFVSKRFLDVAILNVNSTKDNDGFMTIQTDIANYGSIPVSSLDLSYKVSDGANVQETWNGILNPNSFFSYTFISKTATQIGSSNNISCVNIKKANGINDQNQTNNELCNVLNTNDITVSNPIPNPTNADITLPIILNKEIDFSVSIYNSNGQIQYEEKTQKGIVGLNLITLPTANYARGCYIIKTVIDDKIFIKKFIKISNE